jgi:hypothetical protein
LARGAVNFEAHFSIPAQETKLAVYSRREIETHLARQLASH